MFSIYSSAFNLIKNNFDYVGAINNFSRFADEVVIAINKSEDHTLEYLSNFIRLSNKNNVFLIATDFSYGDPLLDGKIKNAALQATTKEFKIGLDMDERLPLWQKDMWEILASQLRFSFARGFLFHSLDLWGAVNLVQDNIEALSKFKWYLHKEGCYRGAVNFAKLPSGHVDINKSDTCELIDEQGNLVPIQMIRGDMSSVNNLLVSLNNVPFVYHLGYANFQERKLRNDNFWSNHWKIESGKNEIPNFLNSEEQMQSKSTVPHNLKLWWYE